jgi:heat shock protein HslJ
MISAIFGTDGTVQGFGGCSDYSGVYTTTGSSVRVTNIISTPTSCGNVLETQERAYLAILGASSTFENTGSTLTILTSSSPPGKLVFQPGNATPSPVITAIVGTWGLTQMTKNYASLSIVAASQPTATFTADGNLSGTGGCNQYSGRYMLSGISSISSSSISIGPLATTKMYCADPVMSQEVAYFGILGNAARWEFLDTSGTLTIWDNSTSLNRLDFKKFVQ